MYAQLTFFTVANNLTCLCKVGVSGYADDAVILFKSINNQRFNLRGVFHSTQATEARIVFSLDWGLISGMGRGWG